MSQSDATWRVYLNEWVTFYSSDAFGPDGQAECLQYFRRKYRGRVRDEDWRVVPGAGVERAARFPYCVQLYLPNLRGEFKDEADARMLRLEHIGEAVSVVQRGSPQEQDLLAYGTKMLPASEVNGGKG